MSDTINSRIKSIRKDLGLTQSDFAERLRISRTHYSNIENGNVEVTEKFVNLVSAMFSINSEWLYSGIGDKYMLTLPERQDYTEKLNMMNDVFLDYLNRLPDTQYFLSVDMFSYFVALLTYINNLKNEDLQSEYLMNCEKILDKLEKYVHTMVARMSMNRKTDYEILYKLKLEENKVIDELKKALFDINQIFTNN